MCSGQSQQDATELNRPLGHPKKHHEDRELECMYTVCTLYILKTFSVARKNRYQVLEDGGLAIKEEDKEIGRDFQIMEKRRRTLKLQKEF